MPWARFDDKFDDDPDCDVVGEVGICLFLCSITYASRNLTDGFIPTARVRRLPGGADSNAVRLLLQVGWWIEAPGGYQIRSYLKYNPSRTEAEAAHDAKVEAGKRGGQRSGESRRGDRPNLAGCAQPALAPAQAPDEASALAPAQAKSKPVSRIPESESRIPNPDTQPDPPYPPGPPGDGDEMPTDDTEADLDAGCVGVLGEMIRFLPDRQQAADLLRRYGCEAVRWQVAAMEWRIANPRGDGIADPGSYLTNALRKSLPLPAAVREAMERDGQQRRAVQAQADAQNRARQEQVKRAGQERLEAVWADLPQGEQQDIEREAKETLLAANVVYRRRAKASPDDWFDHSDARNALLVARNDLLASRGHLASNVSSAGMRDNLCTN